jgi:Plavaka transposase
MAEARDVTDWTPYGSRIAFELADFIYRRNQMSAGDFNTLCELWGATLPHDVPLPFSNYAELCRTIDKTTVGGVAWESINLSYNGPRPDDAPSWMENTHEIWYRDPRLLFKDMLEDTEFQDFFDYAPFRQYDAHGDRQYENVMSANWAWKQAVSNSEFCCLSLLKYSLGYNFAGSPNTRCNVRPGYSWKR